MREEFDTLFATRTGYDALDDEIQEAVPPTAADALLALESSRRLTKFLAARPKSCFESESNRKRARESISIPVAAFRLRNASAPRGNSLRIDCSDASGR